MTDRWTGEKGGKGQQAVIQERKEGGGMLLRENCETSNALVTFNGSLRGSRHLGLDSREEEGGLFGHDIYICIDLLQTKSTPFKSFNAKT